MRSIKTVAGILALSVIGGAASRSYALPPGDPAVARILYSEAVRFGASEKVKLALFETAVVESVMRNLTYGHWDSRGVLQIRTSLWGWATATNPALSADWFLRRAIPRQNWFSSAGALAQSVQGSALPWRYNQEYWNAMAWLNYAKGATSGATSSGVNFVMYRVKVTADILNIRTGPGTGYARVGTYTYGSLVDVYGVSNGWYKVWYGGAWRWIIGGYAPKALPSVKVTSGPLNVRSGPGTGYARVGGLNNGAIVAVFGTSGGWYKIWYGGAWRWILGQYTARA